MKNATHFTLKFWGVRGSHPVPGKTTNRYGGNTSCVEVRAGRHLIILDAGTGIIGLGRELAQRAGQNGQPVKAVLLFSHLHHDHTQGFPFFAPAYFTNAQLEIFLPDMYARDPKGVFAEVMTTPTFPVAFQQTGAEKNLHNLCQTELLVITDEAITKLPATSSPIPDEAIIIRALRSSAHPQGVMIYRVDYQGKSLVYATDIEGYCGGDQRLVKFAQSADLLIHDAQYTEEHYVGALASAPVTQGFGHSTASMACATARAARVGQLVLFHHDPGYDDTTLYGIEHQAREHFANTLAAREGQIINLGKHPPQPAIAETQPLSKGKPMNEKSTRWATR